MFKAPIDPDVGAQLVAPFSLRHRRSNRKSSCVCRSGDVRVEKRATSLATHYGLIKANTAFMSYKRVEILTFKPTSSHLVADNQVTCLCCQIFALALEANSDGSRPFVDSLSHEASRLRLTRLCLFTSCYIKMMQLTTLSRQALIPILRRFTTYLHVTRLCFFQVNGVVCPALKPATISVVLGKKKLKI